MANGANVKADMSGIESLIKGLKDSYSVKIGIIGSKAKGEHDSKSGLTNAEIGTFHEFGTKKMPQRSFLEMPITRKVFAPEKLKDMKKILWKQFFVKTAIKDFMKMIGSASLDAIEDAFNSNGFGEWESLTARTMSAFESKKGITNWRTGTIAQFRKGLRIAGGRQILTDTGGMRRSISFKVYKNK